MEATKNSLEKKNQNLKADFYSAGLAAKKEWAWSDEELLIAIHALDCIIEFMNGAGENGVVRFGLAMKRESLYGFAHARKLKV